MIQSQDLYELKQETIWRQRQALRAWAYFYHIPYPIFAFQDWKIDENGPLPKCLPFVSNIVKKNARWTFGNSFSLIGKGDGYDRILPLIKEMFSGEFYRNSLRMDQEGGYALKFGLFNDEPYIKSYSLVDNIRYWHSQETGKIDRVMLQYPYFDKAQQKIMLYRELWTKDKCYILEPLAIRFSPLKWPSRLSPSPLEYGTYIEIVENNEGLRLEDADTFNVVKEIDNTWGFIPFLIVLNPESDSPLGKGLLWDLYSIIDRYNLTYHSMDRSNQLDSNPIKIFIDSDWDTNDIGGLAPGAEHSIYTRESIANPNIRADVKLLEPRGNLRPFMMEYAESLVKQIEVNVGSITVFPNDIANKGNLTQSVLNLIFLPLIQTIDYRREALSHQLIPFLENCASVLSKTNNYIPLDIKWPQYFSKSSAEKATDVTRLITLESNALMTLEGVLKEIAEMEEETDVEQYISNLKNYTPKLESPGKDSSYKSEGRNLTVPKSDKSIDNE